MKLRIVALGHRMPAWVATGYGEYAKRLNDTTRLVQGNIRYIMDPAMGVVWITGPLLAWWEGVYLECWMLAKFALVVLLSGYHHALARWRKDFAADRNIKPERFYRIANEVPTVLMIGIVILVIVKPF